MPQTVVIAPAVAALAPFRFTVPGQYRWTILSVRAVCARQNGGTGTRSFVLSVSDGTTTVLTAPLLDSAPDPGDMTVTWSNSSVVSSASAASPFVMIPLPSMTLLSGYVITGAIVDPVAGDQWTQAVAWVDQVLT